MSDRLLHLASALSDANPSEETRTVIEPTLFHSRFVDCMEMYATADQVAEYLDAHHLWFRRCAQPMQVELIDSNGYALVVGQFGSFGYEVEPKIGLNLLPQEAGIYRIETIPVPDYEPMGYDVDFRAVMRLEEDPVATGLPQQVPGMTRVQWQLDLTVTIQFPRFVHALPKSLLQSTGDRLLAQIVRQVSHRLTCKVQKDFHSSLGLPLPKRAKKWFFQKSDLPNQPETDLSESDDR